MARVLLIDDDPQVVATNTQALVADGHLVTTAANTAEAQAAIGREMPDLVVLEAMLDGATAGFDLARSLARTNPDLPLIMLSRCDQVLSAAQRAA